MDADLLKRVPRLHPIKQRVAHLKQHLNSLRQLPRRVRVKAADWGELNQLIRGKLEQIKNLS
ncbi:MAG: hypothetical protein KJ063_21640 [Anaerolineae bacterium]|nr:hypothetical protein [Anaerolineae bacterium]